MIAALLLKLARGPLVFFRTTPTKASDMSQGADKPRLTMCVKVPSACTKKECVDELRSFGQDPPESLTVQELRSMVRRSRIEHGYMKERGNALQTDIMDQILRGSLRELQLLAETHQVNYFRKMNHGELRMHLRRWVYRSGDETTVVNFGRHKGQTFAKVAEVDPQYLAWAVQEVRRHPGASWQLIQLSTWAVLTGHVENPFDQKMEMMNTTSGSELGTDFESVLSLDPEVYIIKMEPGNAKAPAPKLELKSQGVNQTAYPSHEKEMMHMIQSLREEVRSLKEAQSSGLGDQERTRKSEKNAA